MYRRALSSSRQPQRSATFGATCRWWHRLVIALLLAGALLAEHAAWAAAGRSLFSSFGSQRRRPVSFQVVPGPSSSSPPPPTDGGEDDVSGGATGFGGIQAAAGKRLNEEVASASRQPSEKAKALQAALKLLTAGNQFGIQLMQYLIAENDNTIMAPVSLAAALGMLYFAAGGATRRELARALYYDQNGVDDRSLDSALRALATASELARSAGFAYEAANFVFVQQGAVNVSDAYATRLRDAFGGRVEPVDFGRTAAAVAHINRVIADATRNQVDGAVDDVAADARLLLANAVYFKGFWKTPFAVKSSFDATFANDGVDEVPVRLMYQRGSFLVKTLPDIGADAIQLPYEGDNTIMLVLLPHDPRGVHEMLRRLDVVHLIRELPTYSNESLDLHMPRFKVRGSYRFKESLKDLGLSDIFTPGAANLSGIDPGGNIYLDDVAHEAKIKVDELGSEASAVTTATIINYSRYPSFNVRHPFVFLIIYKPTGAIFFAGKIIRVNADHSAAAAAAAGSPASGSSGARPSSAESPNRRSSLGGGHSRPSSRYPG